MICKKGKVLKTEVMHISWMCSECLENVDLCEQCKEKFKDGDVVYCYKFSQHVCEKCFNEKEILKNDFTGLAKKTVENLKVLN